MDKQKGFIPILIVLLIAATIGGYFIFTNYSNLSRVKSRDNRTKPAQQTIPPSSTDEIANWKTYTDSNLQLTFKHPSDWSITKIDNGLQLKSGSKNIEIVHLSSPPIVGLALNDWYQSLTLPKTLYDGASKIVDKQSKTIGGINGIQLTEEFHTTRDIIIYLPKSSASVFRIIISSSENPTIQQILSTFKFTQ